MLEPLVTKLNNMRVILASGSARRKEILGATALKFEIHESNFEENLQKENYTFSEFVETTALRKVEDVYEQMKCDVVPPDLIIGCDTMVTYDGKMYGKPKNKEDAIATISKLTSSRLMPNVVYSGVVIFYKGQFEKFTEVTTVYMNELTPEEVIAYVETGEPMGKAGGYGIQGLASSFVERIDGDLNNVIGLPLARLCQKLKQLLW